MYNEDALLKFLEKNNIKINDVMYDNDAVTDEEQIEIEKERSNNCLIIIIFFPQEEKQLNKVDLLFFN